MPANLQPANQVLPGNIPQGPTKHQSNSTNSSNASNVIASDNVGAVSGSAVSDVVVANTGLDVDTKLDLALQAIEEATRAKSATDQTPLPQAEVDGAVLSPDGSEAVAPATLDALAQLETPTPVPTAGGKERAAAVSPDTQVVDAGVGAQAVEYEPTPELPPEVEGYMQRVEDHAELLSEPIVVDGHQTNHVNQHHPTQPVVVLPITEEEEKLARFKSPKYSIRWLVEWSHKIVKEFVGKVIYRIDD